MFGEEVEGIRTRRVDYTCSLVSLCAMHVPFRRPGFPCLRDKSSSLLPYMITFPKESFTQVGQRTIDIINTSLHKLTNVVWKDSKRTEHRVVFVDFIYKCCSIQ